MNLAKTQSAPLMNLSKTAGVMPDQIHFGSNWGKINGRSVDLDAAAFVFDKNGNFMADVFTNHLGGTLNIGYLNHSGDDLQGDDAPDDDDNEIISMLFDRMPENAGCVVFTLHSFSSDPFDRVPDANMRVYSGPKNKPATDPIVFNLEQDETFKGALAVVAGVARRDESGKWLFTAVGKAFKAKGINPMRDHLKSNIAAYMGGNVSAVKEGGRGFFGRMKDSVLG